MTGPPIVAVPVKRFFVAKRRLSTVLGASDRSRLGRDLALRTLEVVSEAMSTPPTVLASDAEVESFAHDAGYPSMLDSAPSLDAALNGFATRALASGRCWMVVFADLPLLAADDVSHLVHMLASHPAVIAPSNDGGTSVIGATSLLRFSFGPGSFHRHLAAVPETAVVSRLGTALDLDDPSDLTAASGHDRGAWLRRYPSTR